MASKYYVNQAPQDLEVLARCFPNLVGEETNVPRGHWYANRPG